jgi:uncharacterized Zn-binding protein involved in type VI secretion
MPLVARGNGVDVVNTGHVCCVVPIDISTKGGSDSVFVHEKPIHRLTDTNEEHSHCPPVYSTLISEASPTVFANNLAVARQGDPYDCTAYVKTVTQSNVYADGE